MKIITHFHFQVGEVFALGGLAFYVGLRGFFTMEDQGLLKQEGSGPPKCQLLMVQKLSTRHHKTLGINGR